MKLITIKNRWSDKIIIKGKAKDIKELLETNREADLREANLWGANLWEANLREANLRGANLREADLWGAKIEFLQYPSIRLISSIQLGDLPDPLTLELMRKDAYGHPVPEKFDTWSRGGDCPYQNEERMWWFTEKKELWKPGPPEMTDRDLVRAICTEKGWKIKGYL